ncbi:MAG: osmoprotectant transport system permease protein [Planctomycetota bacterium]|jgi:osmoprotectant transport system permease protein
MLRNKFCRVLVLVLAFLLAGAGRAQEQVVIGSKNFTESRILGELMALLIEEHTALEVEHRSGLGGTLVCFAALEAGEIDVYPEYTGTGWSAILKREGGIGDSLSTFLQVEEEFRSRYGIEWLQPFGLNNTYALAMNAERATELGVRSISDLIPHASKLRAGFSHEFVERSDGYAGLSPFYGLKLGKVNGMEHGLAYEAMAAGEIDLIDAYSTDGKLLRYSLTVLADDRGFFPPYNAAPIVRAEALSRYPKLRATLQRAAFQISDEEMTTLNYEVEVDRREFRDVARDFLNSKGLIAKSLESQGTVEQSLVGYFASRWSETLRLVVEHLQLTIISVLLAALFAIPLGIWITTNSVARRLSLGLASIMQTVPSLALLAMMIAVPGLGLSVRSAIVALFLYAILPILRNTCAGIEAVDPDLVDAAKGMGLSRLQVLLKIQLPLATRTIMAGIRTATVISIGVATLAAFIGAGGLGEPIVTGLYLNDSRLILSGAVPAAILALFADFMLSRIERYLAVRG